jgi:hypothetical protein
MLFFDGQLRGNKFDAASIDNLAPTIPMFAIRGQNGRKRPLKKSNQSPASRVCI